MELLTHSYSGITLSIPLSIDRSGRDIEIAVKTRGRTGGNNGFGTHTARWTRRRERREHGSLVAPLGVDRVPLDLRVDSDTKGLDDIASLLSL